MSIGDDLDLEALAKRLLAGDLSLHEARQRVASWSTRVAGIDADTDPDTAIERQESRVRLADSLRASFPLLLSRHNTSALDLGHLLRDAGALLGPSMEALVALLAGSHFLTLYGSEEALDFLDFARQSVDSDLQAQALCQWLRCHYELKHDEVLRQHLPEALDLASSSDDAPTLVALLHLKGNHLGHREPEAALTAIDEAIERRKSLPATPKPLFVIPPSELELWSSRGKIARDAGRFEEAVRSFEQARNLADQEQAEWVSAFMLSEIGVTWQVAGAEARAAKVLRRAAREADRLGDRRAALRWGGWISGAIDSSQMKSSDHLANALRLLRQQEPDLEAAHETLRQCFAAARREGLQKVEVMARNLLGYLYAKQGELHRAWMAYEEAIHQAREIGDEHLEMVIRFNLCLVLFDLRYFGQAQPRLIQVIEQGERLRSEAHSAEIRKALSGRLVLAYEALITLFSIGWSHDDGRTAQAPDPEQVLRLSQRAQGINLGGWLALGAELARSPHPDLRARIRELREAEVRLERAAVGDTPLASWIEEVERRRSALDTALVTAGRSRGVAVAPILGVDEVAWSLGDSGLFIDLFAAEHQVFFTSVSGDGETRCDGISWSRRERLDWLDRWSTVMAALQTSVRGDDVGDWRLVADPMVGRAPLATAEVKAESVDDLLGELDDRFFKPLAEAVGCQKAPARCLISPHRELFILPFWPFANLLGDGSFSLLPNASCLPLLAMRPHATGRRFKIGDATETLPYADLELANLGDYDLLEPMLGPLLEELPQASAIHFAGHGLFDGANPFDSGLIVDPELPSDLDPQVFVAGHWGRRRLPCRRLTVTGVLTSLELAACELVVLSACCTGLPELHPAGEVTGLPSAFLVAGARNVIASLWPTHDGATALLMQELYSHFNSTRSPSTALHQATKALARMERTEAVRRLGEERAVPAGDRPFAAPVFTMPFQSYGID